MPIWLTVRDIYDLAKPDEIKRFFAESMDDDIGNLVLAPNNRKALLVQLRETLCATSAAS